MTDLPYWLTLINDSRLSLTRVKPIIQQWCATESRPLAELFSLSPLEWMTTFGLSEAEADPLIDLSDKVAAQAQALQIWHDMGIEPVTFLDPRYPQRLKQSLPPTQQPLILWTQGATHLLNEPSVALFDHQVDLSDTVEGVLETLETAEIGLVNGYTRGFERAAFDKMTQLSDGRAMAILPLGLAAFHETTTKLTRAKGSQRILLVSPFAPQTPFQPKFGEGCKRLVDHLATVLLLLQPDDALRQRAQAAIAAGLTLFVEATNEDAAALLEQGALSLTDPSELVEMVQQAVIDSAMNEATGAPQSATASESAEPYTLPVDAPLEPIETDEAIDLLSQNGNLPPVLRERLQRQQAE